MWTFFFLLAVGLICGLLVWDFRRKARAREVVSQERFAQIFESSLAAGARGEAGPAAPAPTPPPTSAPATPLAAGQPARDAERFLGQTETLVYYLLRAGLRDCPVFARVPVAAVLGSAAALRLSPAAVDFIVCDRSMRVIVAIQLSDGSRAGAVRRLDPQPFRAAGIRFVTLDPRALPRRADVRSAVLGEGAPA